MGGSIRWISVSAVAVLALVGGGAAATASIDHAGRVIEAERLIEHAHTARADYQDARYVMAAVVQRFEALERVAPALGRLTGAVEASTVTRLSQQLRVGRTVAASRGIAEPATATADRIPRVDDETDWTSVRSALSEASRLATLWREAERRVSQPAAYFDSIVEDVAALLAETSASAAASIPKLLADHALAAPEARDAVAAASAALGEEGDRVAALIAYADAVDALRESHRLERERIAAEAAAAAKSRPGSSARGSENARPGGAESGGSGDAPEAGGSPTWVPDTKRYADPRGEYTPGCRLGPEYYRADPGPGGTAIIASVPHAYDYRIEGDWVVVYICSW